jgi:hypothetical protein
MKQKIGISFLSIAVIALLIGITIFNWRGSFKRETGELISQDIARLVAIFDDINNTAGILSFDHQKNDINFLNIKKDGFIGSEIGSMNLIHPDKWQGPYEKEIPRIEEEDYMVVRTKKGYFVIPGDRVRLPNGKIIGKDILLDEDADIESMMQDEQMLSYKGKALAGKIMITGRHASMPPQVIFPEE